MTGSRRALSGSIALLLLGVLAACGGQGVKEEILVPPTTEVLGAEVRGALVGVEGGTLRFQDMPGLESRFQAGDVLVSEPVSPLAPQGLLRKVKAVRREGGFLVVETEGARIQEAIHQGTLDVSGWELRASSLVRTQALQPGIRAQGLSYTLDTDLGTGGKVRVEGTLSLRPLLDLSLGIRCDRVVAGACAEVPDLDFRVLTTLEQNATLKVTGDTNVLAGKEVPIAEEIFAPQTYMVGPVPVVLTPKLTVYLTGTVEADGSFRFEARQSLTLGAGFHYNSDSGFRDLSHYAYTLSTPVHTFSGSLGAQALFGVRFQVLLYGVTGPFGTLEGGAGFKANLNGFGKGGETLLWELNACGKLSVGITAVEVLDLRYSKELLAQCVEVERQVNALPEVVVVSPTAATQIYRGVGTTLKAQVSDPDGQPVSCAWTSSRIGDPSPVGCETVAVFTSTGPRVLTVTATDSAGGRRSQSVNVNVQEPPAILVEITTPSEGSGLRPEVYVLLSGRASGGTGPYTYTWRVAYPTDSSGRGGTLYAIGSGDARLWKPQDTLPVPPGTVRWARLILEVQDSLGATGERSILVLIGVLE
ncbi:hypothetical protein [Thermus caliditerrae]|uniref:hypothetical protein n=1 Tax=Thermus caliditerrae TaxID=1330700 RepID=UPI001F449E05|nr:hypothetical protein [Thermus caliditerrae]